MGGQNRLVFNSDCARTYDTTTTPAPEFTTTAAPTRAGNACTCDNGSGAVGDDCEIDESEVCVSCTTNFALTNDKLCKPNCAGLGWNQTVNDETNLFHGKTQIIDGVCASTFLNTFQSNGGPCEPYKNSQPLNTYTDNVAACNSMKARMCTLAELTALVPAVHKFSTCARIPRFYWSTSKTATGGAITACTDAQHALYAHDFEGKKNKCKDDTIPTFNTMICCADE